MRPLFQSKITNIELQGIEYQLKRIADAIENLVAKPDVQPNIDFDVDEFSAVSYADEEKELIDQHLGRRIGGVLVE